MAEDLILEVAEAEWLTAKNRYELLAPLAEQDKISSTDLQHALKMLGISRAHFYRLLRRFQDSDKLLSSLTPRRKTGGRGKGRISCGVETIISICINEFYLDRQKHRASKVVEEVILRCKSKGFKPPSHTTIRNRIKRIAYEKKIKKREGSKKSRAAKPVKPSTPEADYPLQQVQIDHTMVDLIVVDEISRKPLGRPFLTIAIDSFSRFIVGIYLSMEAPSATSVGLCLTNAVFKKEAYLSELGIDLPWPSYGVPCEIFSDNGREFHSQALSRGCEQYGIRLSYRPPGQPHYGGIVERVIGTLMRRVHELPGTTFSNISEKGGYDSEKKAILSLRELESWLVLAILGSYHQKVHSSLGESPSEVFRKGIELNPELLVCPPSGSNFLIDFLPVYQRKLQRDGFHLDHLIYYSDSLNSLIMKGDKAQFYLIRRDPRDLSRIYVLCPYSKDYLEIPYRNLDSPPISLWEHRHALKDLKKSSNGSVNDQMIFKTVNSQREIVKEASDRSRTARKYLARQKAVASTQLKTEKKIQEVVRNSAGEVKYDDAKPFDNIEEW